MEMQKLMVTRILMSKTIVLFIVLGSVYLYSQQYVISLLSVKIYEDSSALIFL